MPLTERPLTASVTITKTASGSSSTWFNTTAQTASTNEFRILNGTIELSGSNKASSVTFNIEDRDEKLFSTFTVGASVSIKLGKLGSTFATVFFGLVESARLKREESNMSYLTIQASDLQQKLMNTLVLNYERHQKRNTDGTLDTADSANMLVTDVIINLMNSSDKSVYFNGVNTSITTSSTTITPNKGVSIPDVVFHYKPLHDCLKELFDYLKYEWLVDSSAQLIGRPIETATDSGVTLDTSTIIALDLEDDITGTKNTVWVLGANQISATGGTLTSGNTMNNSSLYLAQKFTAVADNLSQVSMYIEKVGSPGALNVAVYTDNSNKPSNTALTYTQLDANGIATTAGWRAIEVAQKVTVNEPYWIALFNQNDTTNYYKWHTNAGSSASTSTSQDGNTWSTVAATSTFTHNIFYESPTVGFAQDKPSTSTWGDRQHAERQSEINEKVFGDFYAKGLVNILGKKKQTARITSVSPDTILLPGRRVTVDDDRVITTTFIMTDVTYNLSGHEAYSVDVDCMRYVAP